ncbi:MAG TPA: hypothetical protein VMF91_13140 [Bryobacteraceae bacterium]|nr:hypothetical protein [Bryobacteraceae bacterium]
MSDHNHLSALRPWTESPLWIELQRRNDPYSTASRLLSNVTPGIERVLKSGASSPKDFTLHDEGHAFRVTEWMAQIIRSDVLARLSDAEIAILILAAYLHDIGMTPEWGKVGAHKEYLVSGSETGFRGDELETFQIWLAEREGLHFAPPVDSFQKIEELATYYCRLRHNEWSAEWISNNLSSAQPSLYYGWLEDLIAICKSHHEGYDSLAASKFDPRDLGQAGVVHRRYLAVVLRIADILENDPERTPDVILRHRAITASSEPHWQKNEQMITTLEDGKLRVSATPSRAVLFKAVEETCDEIEAELTLCDRLTREHPFNIHPVTGKPTLPHRWDLDPFVTRKIQEPSGAYEYIYGAFRPNTKKVLDLLGGQQLYGNYFASVRELLQNAFDAVKEQIARVQLRRKRPDEEYRALLALENRVELRFETDGNSHKLICRDTGVGMSKQVIKDHLLVSGEPSSSERIAFQLACRKASVKFERSGEFGIGVLSYFMIADHVLFRTKASEESDAQDMRGWEFETWGVGSFGELRHIDGLSHGTEVQLGLRAALIPAPEQLFSELRKYVEDLIAISPCDFELATNLLGVQPLRLVPGWANRESHLTESLASNFERTFGRGYSTDDPSLSAHEQTARAAQAAQIGAAKGRMLAVTRWGEPHEGELPGQLGRYRITLRYFDVNGNASLAYLFVQEPVGSKSELTLSSIQGAHGFLPDIQSEWSSKGFAVAQPFIGAVMDAVGLLYSTFRVHLDIAETRRARVGVNRYNLQLDKSAAEEILDFIRKKTGEIATAFLQEHRNSIYSTLNRRLLDVPVPSEEVQHWAVYHSQQELLWQGVEWPAGWTDQQFRKPSLFLNDDRVSLCPTLSIKRERYLEHATPFATAPGKFILGPPAESILLSIWLNPGSETPLSTVSSADFPPTWIRLLGCELNYAGKDMVFLNREHPFAVYALGAEFNWTNKVISSYGQDRRRNAFPSEEQRTKISTEPAEALDWLLACFLSGSVDEIWDSLKERDPGFLPSAWAALGLSASENVAFVTGTSSLRATGCVVTPDECRQRYLGARADVWKEFLPPVPPDWQLTVGPAE